MWVFNSESIARAAFACKKPIISAIGHEIDISILDFVCDARAATPTQAVEIALPDIYSLKMQFSALERTLSRAINYKVEMYKNKLSFIEKSEGFSVFRNRVKTDSDRLISLNNILKKEISRKIQNLSADINTKTQILENLSPINMLKKGYGLIYKDNTPVKNYNFTVGESAKIVTFSQEIDCEITNVKIRKA